MTLRRHKYDQNNDMQLVWNSASYVSTFISTSQQYTWQMQYDLSSEGYWWELTVSARAVWLEAEKEKAVVQRWFPEEQFEPAYITLDWT